jgi:spoIIIJ-associated protein
MSDIGDPGEGTQEVVVEEEAIVGVESPEPAVADGEAAAGASDTEGGAEEPESEEDRLAMALEDALDFVEGLLEAMDVDGDATAEIRDRRVYVTVEGEEAALLIGHHGQTLDAIQELLRSAIQRQVRARVWVTLDVQGYRERRKEALQERAREMAARALDEGEVEFEPMNAFERKIIHDAIGEIEGVTSFSEGEDPYRRVVIAPAED